MATAQEMLNEVNKYRKENQKILDELYAEAMRKIQREAQKGNREVELNM